MFRGDLIVDGYNVLFASGVHVPADGAQSLHRSRDILLRLISRKLTSRERQRTTIVFDAPEQFLGASPPRESHELLVMFADHDGDADAAIEQLIIQNTAPRRLCVVSSDHRLQRAARRRRARFLDSDTFLRHLSRRSSHRIRHDRDVEPSAKHSGGLPPAEVDAWLRVFEGTDDLRHDPDPLVRKTTEQEIERTSPDLERPDPEPIVRADGFRKLQSNGNPENSSETPAETADEISFWESRIAELDQDDPRRQD